MRTLRTISLMLPLLIAACVPRAGLEPEPGPKLPPIPFREGPLEIDVVYPAEGARIAASDSNFIFGNVGTGEGELWINGERVVVEPNGAFLAFLPVPPNGVYELLAKANGKEAALLRNVKVPAFAGTPPEMGSIKVVSVTPRGTHTGRTGERLPVRVRATPGLKARLLLPDGTTIPLNEQPVIERAEGFMADASVRPREFVEYAGAIPLRSPLLPRDRQVGVPTLVPIEGGVKSATVELTRGTDTVRVPLELGLGVLAEGETRVGVVASDRPDRAAVGTAVPGPGTPYHWSFPNGTRLLITGEKGDEFRVALTDDLSVWVSKADVRLLPVGAPEPRGAVGTVRVLPEEEYVDIRLATTEKLPFQVNAHDRWLTLNVYGAEPRTNWMHYGLEDPLLRSVAWEQQRDDLYFLRVELGQPLWGYQTFYDEAGNLVLRIRRPPEIDPERPLRGLHVGVDAGHPPGGAVGPTGLTEAVANLAISKRIVRMLEERGAAVFETRPEAEAVGLGARPLLAAQEGVDLLVSVHNNAFPDGVDPFKNNGTSVFYNQPQSLDFARHLQREIVEELALRDLGIAWADLALVRPTWMPAVLTETMFLMIPRQEAALRDPEVLERIARAHVEAMEGFLRERAALQVRR